MRLRKCTCIVLAVVCGSATLYELPNARRIWRYTLNARDVNQTAATDNATSFVTQEMAAADSEAAALIAYCLEDANDQDLGHLVMRYPQNEFFLAQLADKLQETHCIDHRAALAVTNRLIALSPKNAHYRYLKGWILLNPPRDTDREREALLQFELGNNLPDFYLPYSRYQQRVDRLCDEAGMTVWDRSKIRPAETGMYFDLGAHILRSQGPYATLSTATFEDLCGAVSVMAERLVDCGETYVQLEHGVFLLQQIETARLRTASLSPEQAWQSRLHIGQAIALGEVLDRWYGDLLTSGMTLMKTGLVAIVPLTLALQLPLIWLFMVFVNLLRGRVATASVSIKAYAIFIFALIGFPSLLVLVAFLNARLPGASLASIVFMGGPTMIAGLLWLLGHLHPLDHTRFRRERRWATRICGSLWILGLAVLVIGVSTNDQPSGLEFWLVLSAVALSWSLLLTILWALMAYRQHIIRALPYDRILRTRFFQASLLLFVATGAIRMVWRVPAAPAVLASVTLLLVGMTATHATQSRVIALDALRRFFAREGQIVATRTKVLHLMSAILLICWMAVLIGIDLSAARWRRLDTLLTNPLALYGPIPGATGKTYEHTILRGDWGGNRSRGSGPDAGVPKYMHLATPEDVAAFLTNRQTEGKLLSDEALLRLTTQGGRDLRPMVMAEIREPNALQVLLRRAQWSDAATKEQLVSRFEEEFAELGEPYTRIRENPNGLQALLMKAQWADEGAITELEQRFAIQIARVRDGLAPMQDGDKDHIRSQLRELITIHETLIASSGRDQVARWTRKDRRRSYLLEQLLTEADMLDTGPLPPPPSISARKLESLLDLAEALAFVSEPEEAQAYFHWLIEPLAAQRRQNRTQDAHTRRRRYNHDGVAPCLFYRSMMGLPPAQAASLLKEYVRKSQLSNPFEETEFLEVFGRAGDRTLAEWMVQKVAESPPSKEVHDIPVGRIITAGEEFKVSIEDTSREYLETAYPYLDTGSTAFLLEHLDSEQATLRAFVVWRLTTLGYNWSQQQLSPLLADSHWKVRLNALFSCDTAGLEGVHDDQNAIVQTLARFLIEAETHHAPGSEQGI